MEIIKTNLVIDNNYQPSIDQDQTLYFNRAFAFVQTNYQDQLDRFAKISLNKLSPTVFFEEYVWRICCLESSIKEASKVYPLLSKKIIPLYGSFSLMHKLPELENIRDSLLNFLDNEKVEAIIRCAQIVHNGIKLFGWDFYKDNYLNTSQKLEALPLMDSISSKYLASNIGLTQDVMESKCLNGLAIRWGFDNVSMLCQNIKQHFNLSLKVISLILWYTVITFETNISET